MHRSVMVAALAAAAAALALALAGCGQTTNPAACCTGPTDCPNIGLEQPQDCATGLACVDNRCTVASCASTGCTADAPVCDTRSDTCQACTGPDDCAKYGAADQCNADTGACVECVADSGCDSTTPICDAGACRACRLDTDCDSGACGDDGACVPEAQIAYMAPNGVLEGPCDRATPCGDFSVVKQVLTLERQNIVLAPGSYQTFGANFSSDFGGPARVTVHGHGAHVEDGDAETMFRVEAPTTFRDLTISYLEGTAITAFAPLRLDRVHIKSIWPLSIYGRADLRDARIEAIGNGEGVVLQAGSSLNIHRATIFGGRNAIRAEAPVRVEISNLLAYGTSQTGLVLNSASGSIEFSTIADTGDDTAPGNGLRCGNLAVRSTIVWAPGFQTPVTGSCNFTNSIAGPLAVPGADNPDPKFVNADVSNYRLGSDSPARDMANTGPATDFEGDLRPQGARYDLGADESP